MSLGTFGGIVRADGTMEVDGLDFSNGRQPLRVWKRTQEMLVMFAPSGKCWNGRHVPARFYLFQILEAHKNGRVKLLHITNFERAKPSVTPRQETR